jgi:hypothetical protein
MRYWKRFNTSFEEGIAAAITDKNNTEIYAKEDGDDTCFGEDTLIHTSKGLQKISKINIGDMVLTRWGYRPVNRVIKRWSKVWKWNNTIITENHPIITSRGKVDVCNLTNQDIILYVSRRRFLWLKQLHTTISCIAGIPKATKEIIGFIINAGLRAAYYTFIEKFGLMRLVKFLKGLLSTILMGILETIKHQIFNVLKKQFIHVITGNQILGTQVISLKNIGQNVKNAQKNGIDQKKVKNGIECIMKKSEARFFPSKKETATCAETNTLRPIMDVQDSVQIHANLRGEENLTSMMLKESVSCVENPSWLVSTPKTDFVVKTALPSTSHEYAGLATVYNLTVNEHHEFFANGVLVANCDESRYGLVKLWSWIAQQKGQEVTNAKTKKLNSELLKKSWLEL